MKSINLLLRWKVAKQLVLKRSCKSNNRPQTSKNVLTKKSALLKFMSRCYISFRNQPVEVLQSRTG